MSIVTPIGALDYRLPQAGRIRIGEQVKARSGKMMGTTLDTFKFTSGERDLLIPLAERYGGTVEPWNVSGSGDKWQMKSDATKIDVQVHVAGSVSLAYELWNPHLIRRCNGNRCQVLTSTPDDVGFEEVECICARKGIIECAKKLRLSVLLPNMPTLGMWRFDSASENTITELLGFMRYMEEWAGNGLHACTMAMRVMRRPGERGKPGKVFTVVSLDYPEGLGSLLAGESRLVQLPTTVNPTAGELVAGAPPVTGEPPPEPGGIGGAGEVDRSQASDPSPASPPTCPTCHGKEWVNDPFGMGEAPCPDCQVVDAEIVDDFADLRDGETHEDHRAQWLDEIKASPRQANKALIRGHKIARELGEEPPRSIDDLTPPVIDRLIVEMNHLRKAGDDDARAAADR